MKGEKIYSWIFVECKLIKEMQKNLYIFALEILKQKSNNSYIWNT